jgi:two-component system cell cycle sensor histidine kinase PleC
MQDSVGDYGHIAAGSPVSAQRRMLEMRLKEARDKLSSETGARPAFDTELTILFARNRLSSAFLIPILIVLVAGAGSFFLKPMPLLVWTLGMLLAHTIEVICCRQFMHTDKQPFKVRRWRRSFSILEAINGLAWSLIPLLPIAQDPLSAWIFLFAVTLMVIGIGALMSSQLPNAVTAGTAPIVISLVIKFALVAEPLCIALAIIAVCAEIYFLFLAKRLHLNSLDNLTIRLEKDGLIAELEQAKATSDEARRRAEAASLAKSRFLATMSHELRTPLNAILGFSEIMKNEILGPMPNTNYKDYSDDIHKSGQHLLNLINEILDLSRIEAGKFELNEESVNLVATVEDSVRLLKLRAQSKGINLKETYEEDMPAIWADERAIRQITLNLLSNAIKFTPAEGTISVKSGWTAGGGQYLSVQDTGPGIPDDEIPIVLASFGQGSNALKTAEQGAGLGLPIVKGLVDMHGGTFTFKSKLRVGTEVIITFPAERVMQALPPIKDGAKKATR